MFSFLRKKSPFPVQEIYRQAVRQARLEAFYQDYNVPDTMDGRFELITLHIYLVIEKIRNQKFNQDLFDYMFRDMDKALREMGIGDLSVPRHMKRMMTAFNGRIQAYDSAKNIQDLSEALRRNVYGTIHDPSAETIEELAHYTTKVRDLFKNQDLKAFMNGEIEYPSPSIVEVDEVQYA